MDGKKRVEVFTAGCPVCEDLLAEVRTGIQDCCELQVLDMNQPEVAARARALGVRSIPALFVDGQPAAACC